jgi:hypothetical protein
MGAAVRMQFALPVSMHEGAPTPALVERLERLQIEIEALNGVLAEMVENRRRAHERKVSGAGEMARFRREAKRLSQFAPS